MLMPKEVIVDPFNSEDLSLQSVRPGNQSQAIGPVSAVSEQFSMNNNVDDKFLRQFEESYKL